MDASSVLTDDETPECIDLVLGTLVLRVGTSRRAVRSEHPWLVRKRAPTTGATEALRRVTRYLLGTQDAHININLRV